jgi:hypothetical protein
VRFSESKPTPAKERARVRAAFDDLRRLCDHYSVLEKLYKEFAEFTPAARKTPHVCGVETYTVFPGLKQVGMEELVEEIARSDIEDETFRNYAAARARELASGSSDARGLANAAKTIQVFGMVAVQAISRGVAVYPHTPQDAKRRFTGKRSASKLEVERGVLHEVAGCEGAIARIKLAAGKRDHVFDGIAHAVLAIEAAVAHGTHHLFRA